MKKVIMFLMVYVILQISCTSFGEHIVILNGGSVISSEGESELRGVYALNDAFSSVKWNCIVNVQDDDVPFYCRDISNERVFGFQLKGEVNVFSFDETECKNEYTLNINDGYHIIATDITNKGLFYIVRSEQDTSKELYITQVGYISESHSKMISLSTRNILDEYDTYIFNNGSVIYYDTVEEWSCGLFAAADGKKYMIDNLGEYEYMKCPLCIKGNEIYYWKSTDGIMTLYRARLCEDSFEITEVTS